MKIKRQKSVLIGFSGGVDSTVSTIILKNKGYKVTAAFLKMYSDTKNPLTGQCSYLSDLKMARKVAAKLNIPLIILDYEKTYKKYVLDPMFSSYKVGLTPNPDLACNTIIKFPYLWKEAEKRKIGYIATGHYARIKKEKNSYSLLKAKDEEKDQSYFLAGLTQKDLSHTLFPIGNHSKSKVREIARKNNLPNWNKHGTVGICFVGQIPMQSFLQEKIKINPGKILLHNKTIIGVHKGIAFYTLGQKITKNNTLKLKKTKELSQSRLYIAKKDNKKNELIAVPENNPLLKTKKVRIKNIHFINKKERIPSNLTARIRHLGVLHSGKLHKEKNHFHFTFKKPIKIAAPGQYLVLYSKDKVIASGEIT